MAACPVPTGTVSLEPAAAFSAAQEEAEISLQMHALSITDQIDSQISYPFTETSDS